MTRDKLDFLLSAFCLSLYNNTMPSQLFCTHPSHVLYSCLSRRSKEYRGNTCKCTISVRYRYPTVASSALLVADSTCDSRVLVLRSSWPPPESQERRYEVITKVKSYCATETDVQGGKKSWQKISVVSLERICKWEEGEARGSWEGGRDRGEELGPKAEEARIAEGIEEGEKRLDTSSNKVKSIHKKRKLVRRGRRWKRPVAVKESERRCWWRRWKTFSLAPGPAGVYAGPLWVSDLYSNPGDSWRCQRRASFSYTPPPQPHPQDSAMCLCTQQTRTVTTCGYHIDTCSPSSYDLLNNITQSMVRLVVSPLRYNIPYV